MADYSYGRGDAVPIPLTTNEKQPMAETQYAPVSEEIRKLARITAARIEAWSNSGDDGAARDVIRKILEEVFADYGRDERVKEAETVLREVDWTVIARGKGISTIKGWLQERIAKLKAGTA